MHSKKSTNECRLGWYFCEIVRFLFDTSLIPFNWDIQERGTNVSGGRHLLMTTQIKALIQVFTLHMSIFFCLYLVKNGKGKNY